MNASKCRALAACVVILPLASCVSTYEPIVAAPVPLEMAQARCEMLSTSTQQGYFAYGSQSYVAGAALGNAIGNAVRQDQFIRQCMTLSGWRRTDGSAPQAKNIQRAPRHKGPGPFPPAPKA